MNVEKPKSKLSLRPITTGANSAMNQSEFLAIICNLLKARENLCVQGAIGFASNWLKYWRETFKPITKRSNRNHVITFDSHSKTALFPKPTESFHCIGIYPVVSENRPFSRGRVRGPSVCAVYERGVYSFHIILSRRNYLRWGLASQ